MISRLESELKHLIEIVPYSDENRVKIGKQIEKHLKIIEINRNLKLSDLFRSDFQLYKLWGNVEGTFCAWQGSRVEVFKLKPEILPNQFKNLIDTNHNSFVLPGTDYYDKYIIPKEILENFYDELLIKHHGPEIRIIINDIFYKDLAGIIMGFLTN